MLDSYLSLLDVPRAGPSVDYMFELHRAHVSRVPYTNLELMRGNRTSIDPESSVRQILAGKGGYCFHLNGALSWLLRQLGFAVTMHRGFVRNHGHIGEAPLNHLVLLVHDLDGVWIFDAGLGDGLYEPMPLVPGVYQQGPFRYGLKAGERWFFTHDRTGSFESMEFEPAATTINAFAEVHERFSTSPDSPFRKYLTAQVRNAERVSIVRNCTSTVIDASGRRDETLESQREWLGALAALGLNDCDDLWESERRAHEAWLASL